MKEHRQALGPDHPAAQGRVDGVGVDERLARLQRALRDAVAEATFFEIYGNLAAFYLRDQPSAEAKALPADPRELSFVKEALASIDKGGYAEALARVAFLMAHKDEPLPLSRLQLAHDLLDEYRDLLPDLPLDEVRRIGGEQEIIARYEPDKAVETLPVLLARRERPRSPAHAARSRARRQARATDSALGRAERDARTNSQRAWRDGAPAGRVAARSGR